MRAFFLVFLISVCPSVFSAPLGSSTHALPSIIQGETFSSGGTAKVFSKSAIPAIFDKRSTSYNAFIVDGVQYRLFKVKWPLLTWSDTSGKKYSADISNLTTQFLTSKGRSVHITLTQEFINVAVYRPNSDSNFYVRLYWEY